MLNSSSSLIVNSVPQFHKPILPKVSNYCRGTSKIHSMTPSLTSRPLSNPQSRDNITTKSSDFDDFDEAISLSAVNLFAPPS